MNAVTLRDIELDIYRRLDKNTVNIDPVTKARILNFIQDRYRELMRIDGIDLRDEPGLSVTARGGDPRLQIPMPLATIQNVIDTASRIKLVERPLSWIRQQDPSQPAQVQGVPVCYAVLNNAGIRMRPNPGVPLQIVSSVATDMRTFTLEGCFPDHYVITQGALNGIVPVSLGAGMVQIFRLTLQEPIDNSAAFAVVTIRETATPTNVIVQVSQSAQATAQLMGQTVSVGWTLWLWPTPSTNRQYAIDFMRPLYPLILPDDVPDLPLDFHTLLVWGACEEECLKMDDDRAPYYKGKWETDVKALRAFLHRSRGQRWIPRAGPQGWSDLGPNFPAQRW